MIFYNTLCGKFKNANVFAALLLCLCSASAQSVGFGQSVGVTFEVASIRLTRDPQRSGSIGPAVGGRRFQATNMPLIWIISTAFGISNRQISGLPDAFKDKHYEINATCAEPATRLQMMKMLQALLVDRFMLRFRPSKEELSVYTLTLAKGGPKLTENTSGADLAMRGHLGSTVYTNFPMSVFANALSGEPDINDIVVDRTGLNKAYDFKLAYTPEGVVRGVREGREPAPDPNGPSLFTALQEQLGLKLERHKTKVDLLVVEHIEDQAEN
jgi:uncharacterized protein (TIGR03435 family)